MTKRVLGHGATCCGECDMCAPAVEPKAEPKATVFDLYDEEDDE